MFNKNQKVVWDSDPSSDECVVYHGTVVEDDGGEYVKVKSKGYQKHLQFFWPTRHLIVNNFEIIHSRNSDVFEIARKKLESSW